MRAGGGSRSDGRARRQGDMRAGMLAHHIANAAKLELIVRPKLTSPVSMRLSLGVDVRPGNLDDHLHGHWVKGVVASHAFRAARASWLSFVGEPS